jgi:hypothetical protein
MILAGFSKKDISNEIVRQMVRRCYQKTLINSGAIINNVVIGDEPSISDLTNNDVQSPTSASSSGSTTVDFLLAIKNGSIIDTYREIILVE